MTHLLKLGYKDNSLTLFFLGEQPVSLYWFLIPLIFLCADFMLQLGKILDSSI